METPVSLQKEIEENREIWQKLGIECFAEHPVNQPDKPVRIYLSSKSLGGLLAVNHGDGYHPCYPEESNYPMKGRWFSPGQWRRREWHKATLAVLDPTRFLRGIDSLGMRVATERSAKTRPFFRSAFTVAIMLGMGLNAERWKGENNGGSKRD